MIPAHLEHVFKALDQRDPRDPQHRRKSAKSGAYEGSSPTDDTRTAGVIDPDYCRICTPKGYGCCRCDIAASE